MSSLETNHEDLITRLRKEIKELNVKVEGLTEERDGLKDTVDDIEEELALYAQREIQSIDQYAVLARRVKELEVRLAARGLLPDGAPPRREVIRHRSSI